MENALVPFHAHLYACVCVCVDSFFYEKECCARNGGRVPLFLAWLEQKNANLQSRLADYNSRVISTYLNHAVTVCFCRRGFLERRSFGQGSRSKCYIGLLSQLRTSAAAVIAKRTSNTNASCFANAIVYDESDATPH
jgi:hypothetical protein